MCDITGKTRKRTGYKVLALKNDKYYSTFTGQEIKVGKVPMPPVRCNRISDNWSKSLDITPLKQCSFYNKSFVGKTAVFLSLIDAKEKCTYIAVTVFKDFQIVIVKIVFSGIVYSGVYDAPIIAGDTIKSIELIKSN